MAVHPNRTRGRSRPPGLVKTGTYESVRLESGNAHSSENPSFVAGVIGASGDADRGSPRPAVSSTRVNLVTAGICQARRTGEMTLPASIGRMIGLRNERILTSFYGIGCVVTISRRGYGKFDARQDGQRWRG